MPTTAEPFGLGQPEIVDSRLNAKAGPMPSANSMPRYSRSIRSLVVRNFWEIYSRDDRSIYMLGSPNCFGAYSHLRVNRFMFAVGHSESGIRFDKSHPAIHLVVLFGVPGPAVADYLRCQSLASGGGARNLTVLEALLAAPTRETFIDVWSQHVGRKK